MPLKKKKKTVKKTAGKKKSVKRKSAIKKPPARKKIVKKTKKNLSKKKLSKNKKVRVKQQGNVVGKITHYFPHVMAAVIKVSAPIAVGDTLKIKGHTTDFTQTVASMQIDHLSIKEAKKGNEIGLLVKSRVRQHDVVYKV